MRDTETDNNEKDKASSSREARRRPLQDQHGNLIVVSTSASFLDSFLLLYSCKSLAVALSQDNSSSVIVCSAVMTAPYGDVLVFSKLANRMPTYMDSDTELSIMSS